jgi:hypothetical protein
MTAQLHTTGTDTTYNTEKYREDQLLQKYIQDNWSATNPVATEVAFGHTLQQLGRGTIGGKTITLFCYNVQGASRMNLKGIASAYEFNILVRIDIGVRDVKTSGGTGIDRNRPAKITALSNYLKNFITTHPTGMQANGVHEIRIDGYPEYLFETDSSDVTLFHLVIPVRCHYLMNSY